MEYINGGMGTIKAAFLGIHIGKHCCRDSRQEDPVVEVHIRLRKHERGVKSHLGKKITTILELEMKSH